MKAGLLGGKITINGQQILCGGLSKINLSAHTVFYFMPPTSVTPVDEPASVPPVGSSTDLSAEGIKVG
ncbi:MAG: hypothetical protein A2W85_03980 [Bacteroidetes bacterium GWF2_41_31]|nr:MAG: hypothetical protein A2W85_03980 [Bacteroidetes bacterium GWF2_41_31]